MRKEKGGKEEICARAGKRARWLGQQSPNLWPHLWRVYLSAQAGEVLLVDGRAGGSTAATGSTTAGSGTTTLATARSAVTTTGSTVTTRSTVTTGSAVTTAATTGAVGGAGLLDVTEVNLEEVLLLTLLLALGLLSGAGNVLLLTLVGKLLSGIPLLVRLAALVGRADGLSSKAGLGGLLGKVGIVGDRLVGLLGLLGGSLGLVLVGLGDLLAGTLVIPGLLAALSTPALLDLLAGVTAEVGQLR